MAIVYTDLPAVKFGFIDEAHPTTHTTIVSGDSYPVGGAKSAGNRTAFLIGFDDFPTALKRNKLYGGQVNAYAPKFEREGAVVPGYWYKSAQIIVVDDFDKDTITFDNYPAYVDTYSSAYDILPFA